MRLYDVTVSVGDVNEGAFDSPGQHPLALAMRRSLGMEVFVGRELAGINCPGGLFVVRLPDCAVKVIDAIDAGAAHSSSVGTSFKIVLPWRMH